jgi:hypothetical protein
MNLLLTCTSITSFVLVFYSVRRYRRLSAYDDYTHPVNVKPYGFNDDIERDTSYAQQSNDKRFSSTSSRASIISKRESVEMSTVQRTPSVYSHKRDTQFDDYVARRGSVKKERIGSGDFSYAGAQGEVHESGSLTPTGATLSPTRPRGYSSGRAASWSSDRGLVAVPEEEDDSAAGKESKSEKEKKDREALLGNTPRESVDGPLMPQEVDLSEPRWQRE